MKVSKLYEVEGAFRQEQLHWGLGFRRFCGMRAFISRGDVVELGLESG